MAGDDKGLPGRQTSFTVAKHQKIQRWNVSECVGFLVN